VLNLVRASDGATFYIILYYFSYFYHKQLTMSQSIMDPTKNQEYYNSTILPAINNGQIYQLFMGFGDDFFEVSPFELTFKFDDNVHWVFTNARSITQAIFAKNKLTLPEPNTYNTGTVGKPIWNSLLHYHKWKINVLGGQSITQANHCAYTLFLRAMYVIRVERIKQAQQQQAATEGREIYKQQLIRAQSVVSEHAQILSREPREDKRNQRPQLKPEDVVILDIPNICAHYSHHQGFAAEGARLAVEFFRTRGHQVVGFYPRYMLVANNNKRKLVDNPQFFEKMTKEGIFVCIPSADYDDSYTVNYALRLEHSRIVTNDRYDDYISKSAHFNDERYSHRKDIVRDKLITYSFVGSMFFPNPDIVPQRDAVTLDQPRLIPPEEIKQEEDSDEEDTVSYLQSFINCSEVCFSFAVIQSLMCQLPMFTTPKINKRLAEISGRIMKHQDDLVDIQNRSPRVAKLFKKIFQELVYHSKAGAFKDINDREELFQAASQWIKDLTRECVEPNPGPATKQTGAPKAMKKVEKEIKRIDKTIKHSPIIKHGKQETIAMSPRSFNRLERKAVSKQIRKEVYSEVNTQKEREYARVVQYLADPNSAEAIRFSNPFTTAPTAVAKPFRLIDSSWNKDPTETAYTWTPYYPANDEMVIFAFRDPLRNLVMYDGDRTFTSYRAWYRDDYNSSSAASGGLRLTDEPSFIYFTHAVHTSGYSAHGQTYYPGEADGVTFMYVDGNPANQDGGSPTCLVRINFSNPATGNNISYKLWEMEDGKRILHSQTSSSGGTATSFVELKVSKPGYFAVSLEATASTTPGSLNLSSVFIDIETIETPHWSHRCVNDFQDEIYGIQGLRFISQSVMVSNKAANLYRQGYIASWQVPLGVDWMRYTNFQNVSSANGSTRLNLKNGMYRFLKPSQFEDFDNMAPTEASKGQIQKAYFPLQTKSDYLVIAAKCTTIEGRDTYVTQCCGLEYKTASTWRNVKASFGDPHAFEDALTSMRTMSAVYENPKHIGDIARMALRGAKSLVNGVITYAPVAMNVAKALGAVM